MNIIDAFPIPIKITISHFNNLCNRECHFFSSSRDYIVKIITQTEWNTTPFRGKSINSENLQPTNRISFNVLCTTLKINYVGKVTCMSVTPCLTDFFILFIYVHSLVLFECRLIALCCIGIMAVARRQNYWIWNVFAWDGDGKVSMMFTDKKESFSIAQQQMVPLDTGLNSLSVVESKKYLEYILMWNHF